MEKEKESLFSAIVSTISLLGLIAFFGYIAIGLYSKGNPKEVYCTCSKLTRYSSTMVGRPLVEYSTKDPLTGKVDEHDSYLTVSEFKMRTGESPQLGTCYLKQLKYGIVKASDGIWIQTSLVPECCDNFVVKKGYCKDVYPQYIHEMRN